MENNFRLSNTLMMIEEDIYDEETEESTPTLKTVDIVDYDEAEDMVVISLDEETSISFILEHFVSILKKWDINIKIGE
jgi:hypothetical protein